VDPRSKRAIDKRVSRNWHLMVAVTIASTIGMAIAVAPLLGEQFGTVWPWPNTHFVLLGGLAISVILLVVHLTIQHRRLSTIDGEVRQLEGEVHVLEEVSQQRERQSHARLRALLNISRMMGAVNRLDDVFSSVMDTCIELFAAQQASLMLLDKENNALRVRAAKGHRDPKLVNSAKRNVGEGISGWVAKNRQPLVLGPDIDTERYPGLRVDVCRLTSAIIVPVMLRDELVGVLSIRSRDSSTTYDKEDVQSLQVLAENIGTVIRHSEHVEWMRKTLEAYRIGREKVKAPAS